MLGCGEDSQITVEVDHLQRPENARVEIVVRREGQPMESRDQNPAQWPVSLAVVPKDGNVSGIVVVTARVTIDGEVFSQTSRTPFERGRNVVMRLEFGEVFDGPDAALDAGIADAEVGQDGATETDAGVAPCDFLPDPNDRDQELSALSVAGHSHTTTSGARQDWLLAATRPSLHLYTRTAEMAPGCFDHVMAVHAPGTMSWTETIDLGWDGRHLIIAASAQNGSGGAVWATFAEPGSDRFPAPQEVFQRSPSYIVAGGNTNGMPQETPYVAAGQGSEFIIAHHDDSEWNTGIRQVGTDLAGLPGHLIVARTVGFSPDDAANRHLSAWTVYWNESTSVRSMMPIQTSDTRYPQELTAAGHGPTNPVERQERSWVVAASPGEDNLLHRFRLAGAGSNQNWEPWGSLDIGPLLGNSPAMLDGNFNHWLAVVGSDAEGLRAVWGPIHGEDFEETPIPSSPGFDNFSIAVFPFGFAYRDAEWAIRIHVR